MTEVAPLLLCCDLDRTLIPNGKAEESPDARSRLARLCAHPAVELVFVSGRDLERVLEGIEEWSLPQPDYIIGDVGTTIYAPRSQTGSSDGDWIHWRAWTDEIAPYWNGLTHDDISDLFDDISAIRPQEPSKQGTFKASYYADRGINQDVLDAELHGRLWRNGMDARLVWSVDEAADVLLLDVLPSGASKLHAIEFLIERLAFDERRAMFAGDSGNDLQALASHIHGVLVANADPEVKRRAADMVRAGALDHTLYLARGGLFEMNGNYAGGVLEGLVHYLPETRALMRLPTDDE
ncbi:MAG: HAD-IIB family hydrolase [Halothiobacillaceae bacterium]|nr:HAD-IIB family hydrolase [Halothiobacillaceae bacterium]HER35255.1 HAD-IIB family hydrolase [Halothiobacillaceae bacterium]